MNARFFILPTIARFFRKICPSAGGAVGPWASTSYDGSWPRFGPWATTLGTASATALSTFWRARMRMLAATSRATITPTHRAALAAMIAASVILATPTLWLVPAAQSSAAASSAVQDAAATEDAPQTQPFATEKNDPHQGTPFRVEIPGAGVLEVVGVGEHPSQGRAWWAPDGAPTAVPYERFSGTVHDDASLVREIAVRWVESPPAGVTVNWSVDGFGSTAGGKPLAADGKPIARLGAVAHAFPRNAKTCSLTISVSGGAWETVAETNGQDLFSEGGPQFTFAFTPTSQRDGKLVLTVAHNVEDREVRIIAVKRDGKTLIVGQTNSVGGRGFLQSTAEFADLALDDVQKFCVQARARSHWQVREISLWPGETTTPDVVKIDERITRARAAREAIRQHRDLFDKVDNPDEILRQRLDLIDKVDTPRIPTMRD